MVAASIQSVDFNQWPFQPKRPFIIAGPCGVESEEQVFSVAQALSAMNVQLLRGGIWKPRTRPGSFQGIGEDGLVWLKNAGRSFNLPVAVEVANPKHVEASLNAGIDVLWLGARTTVNPFLVQEIADSLRGVNIPVMVKNPINPELELWIGAFERLNHSGINQLAAIHRGFSSSAQSRYRNSPNWQIPIELRRLFPQLPIICDPSHIAGSRPLIPQLSQIALDLNFDGLMIEVHGNPDQALSDKQQQLTPSSFQELLQSLVIRKESADDAIFVNVLEELRDQIDTIDEKILGMMAERMSVAHQIGKYKRENNITILQVERWNEILKSRLQSGAIKELNSDFIVKLYQLIHDESIRQQTDEMNKSESGSLK